MTLPKEFSADQRKVGIMLGFIIRRCDFYSFQTLQRMENYVS
ncbi:hypothetical protein XM77_c10502 [Vibrio vulnificus]|nr:hypothetical protein XM77_c10502 [Vibrio vulnificus]